jgi:hypothetical protein
MYFNAGVVAVNSKVVGLAPGFLKLLPMSEERKCREFDGRKFSLKKSSPTPIEGSCLSM